MQGRLAVHGPALTELNCFSHVSIGELVLELDKTKLGLRAGSASAAARFGVPDRLLKRHGRWHSKTAKDGYVAGSLAIRLSVSKGLGQ